MSTVKAFTVTQYTQKVFADIEEHDTDFNGHPDLASAYFKAINQGANPEFVGRGVNVESEVVGYHISHAVARYIAANQVRELRNTSIPQYIERCYRTAAAADVLKALSDV
jgi:hypothetical protein